MCDVEIEEKKELPDSVMEKGIVEGKGEDCHGSNLVEEQVTLD